MTGFGYNISGFGSFPNRFAGIEATGGTITTSGNFKVHAFTSSGTFEVTTVGELGTVEYLVIAGGGEPTDCPLPLAPPREVISSNTEFAPCPPKDVLLAPRAPPAPTVTV